jgi:hypothetical protein
MPICPSRRIYLLAVVVSLTDISLRAQNFTAPSVQPSLIDELSSRSMRVGNNALTVTANTDGRHLSRIAARNEADGDVLAQGEAFVLLLKSGKEIRASQLHLDGVPQASPIPALPGASRLAERSEGTQICATLPDKEDGAIFRWCVIARSGTNYVRQALTIRTEGHPLAIGEVRLFNLHDSGVHVVGTVAGSPLVRGNFFMGFEDPLATNDSSGGETTASLHRTLPLAAGQSVTYSSVIGVAPKGQMRRAFLDYVEHERAHPYRTFLHYNTWYDLGYGDRYDQAGAIDRVNAFGTELVRKRHVVMDSFLFDDGWDNDNSLWGFNAGLPNGFAPIKSAAEQYGSGIGVWLSPWGGYSKEKAHRLASADAHGFETVKGGFALSGPRYYQRFEDVCLAMMKNYGVNQFKFDGTGNANEVFPGSAFDSDFSAAIHLIDRLRKQDPSIYINLTTGTSPSPFWLRYADTIWRDGEDHSFAGEGTKRQQWITYRDGQTYRAVVQKGPLYPLNSVMLHGIIYAQKAKGLDADPGHDFADEVHSYFGSGTQLQEMYITPALLSQSDWDTLGTAARWSRENAATLKDTHWLGGDPMQLEIYGWAAWSPEKGIITLRNPANWKQSFALNVAKALELPSGAAQEFEMRQIWGQSPVKDSVLYGAKQVEVELEPFDVITIELKPVAQ